MASSLERKTRTFIAGGTINTNTFVKFDSTAGQVVACGGNERAIGIAEEAATVGQQVEVSMFGGGGRLKISETVAAGKVLTSTSSAQGEIADAADEWFGAIAMEAGVANDIIDVMVWGGYASATDA